MKTPIKILLLEDNIYDAELLCATLEAGALPCRTVRVDTEAGFRKALEGPLDLIISDFTLPSFDGKRALAITRERRPDIPFIFVSGTIGEEKAIESLLAGATDYIIKPNFGRLLPAVNRALKEKEEQNARREAERQLQVTVEQLKNIFDNLDQVFFSYDPLEDKLLQISPACERVFGLPQQTFFDNPRFWKDAAKAEDCEVITSVECNMQAGRNVSCEYRIARPDGTSRWISLKMKPVCDANNQTIRVDGLIADVTEQKQLEAQFLRAQRMENVGSLAGGIAHDLNNVLAPIVMGVELLRDKYHNRDCLSTLAVLELCARRGANLVKQILMFARGVEGQQITVHVGRLIVDLDKMLQRTFPKSIRIITDVAPHLWTVSANKTQVEQVLMNLCLNARDAMPNGGTLTITATNHKSDRNADAKHETYVGIEVRDTGEGIPPENVPKIFDPFFTTKQPGAGTGLGLSTVSAIVKNHGGHIGVESIVGSGTVFRVYLPALVSGVQEKEDVKAVDFPAGHGELILVVDDEAAIRDLAGTILENYGYRVLVAADGTEAINVYLKHRGEIRLVVTDVDMPMMDGAQMIQRLADLNPDVRVVSASGSIETETGKDGKLSGPVRALLQKPFSPARLLQTVKSVIS
jgi:PAS domain S-box-containing protein